MSGFNTRKPPGHPGTHPDRPAERRFSVGTPPAWNSDSAELWISPEEICIAFVANAITRRRILTKLPSDGPELRAGVVYLLTREGVLPSTLRSIQELHDCEPGVFFDVHRGVAMRPVLLRELRVIDDPNSKWIVVRPRSDVPGTYRSVVYVKISRSRYTVLRRRFGLPRLRRVRSEPLTVP